MKYDFNALEQQAQELFEAGRVKEAIPIYLFMADGDPSLDGGYLGKKLGECYEQIGDLHAAKYWYGRAVEENPAREDYAIARQRLDSVKIDDLVSRHHIRRRVQRGSQREELLNLIRENNGISRGEILERMGLRGDKSGKQSVYRDLTRLTKDDRVRQEGDKYYDAANSGAIDIISSRPH
jgi:tetratricopeptide (TPR) repeat protein